jgi:hypothetical protein
MVQRRAARHAINGIPEVEPPQPRLSRLATRSTDRLGVHHLEQQGQTYRLGRAIVAEQCLEVALESGLQVPVEP